MVTGEPVLLDLNEESDSEEQDFEAWEPDPVDADPSKIKDLGFLCVECAQDARKSEEVGHKLTFG